MAKDSTSAVTNSTKKRKRQRTKITSPEDSHNDDGTNPSRTRISTPTNAGATLPLTGITLAISTMDVKSKKEENDNGGASSDTDDHTDQIWSYKTVQKLSMALGARVSGQVHKKLTLLLCTPSALREPATQRVRKAIRHGIPLVHVKWLFDCKAQNKCLEFRDKYLLDTKSKGTIKSDQPALVSTSRKEISDCNGANDLTSDTLDETEEDVSGAGWTPAEDLGCCCVCHENGTAEQCPWCEECSITAANALVTK